MKAPGGRLPTEATVGSTLQPNGTPGPANAVCVDSSGNAYATGSSGNQAFVTKLDSKGRPVFRKYFGDISGSYSGGVAIAVDSAGAIYVAGNTPTSLAAFTNLKKICEEHLAGRYSIEVIDLLDNPLLAKSEQIVTIPTLVRKLPLPVKQIIGDLTDPERVIAGLDLSKTIGK